MTLTNTNHLPCPCGKSSDAYSIQDNGWGRCFRCDKNFPPEQANKYKEDGEITETSRAAAPSRDERRTDFDPIPDVFRDFPQRALSKGTLERYKCFFNEKKHFVTPITKQGVHTGNKIRTPEKTFPQEGDVKGDKDLFGQWVFPAGSAKAITITEGYEDAMAAYEMMGSRYPCVSVHGSSSAEQDCRVNFEYLNSFETIVIAFDNDEPGQEAARKVCNLPFPIGKIKLLRLREFKDANDYKKAGKAEAFTREWWAAPVKKPDGIKLGKEMFDAVVNRKQHFTVQYPWDGMNYMTYGIRLSEVVIVTAETGIGKTSVLKAIEHSLLINPEVVEKGYGVGFLHLEEPNEDTVLGLMSIHNGVPYHLPDTPKPVDDLKSAFDACINNDRVVIWDHFGSNSVDAVLDKVRHMHALGCRYIVLDHLSIIVSDQSGDERKQLDEIATKLKTLCMELNIAVIAVIHQNRQGQIRGTAGVEQLANIVIKIERDNKNANEWIRNVTKVTVEKNRFCGRTGPACYLWYNEATTRMTQLTKEEVELYEQGLAPGDDRIPF